MHFKSIARTVSNFVFLHSACDRFPEWEFGLPPPLGSCEETKADGRSASDYDKFSPEAHVGSWRTPTLVIHGGKDYRFRLCGERVVTIVTSLIIGTEL